jgi:hypothetical protein
MNKPTENDFLFLFQTLEKEAKASWNEAEKRDYLMPFRSFTPSKILFGSLPKHDSCPSLGYLSKNPFVIGMNGGKIAPPTKRKYQNDHLEYLYDEKGKIRYVTSVWGSDGHLFGSFLVEEKMAALFDGEGQLEEIVLWGEEEGFDFETEISYRYLPQIEKRIRLDERHFLSWQSLPTARDVLLFRFEGKDLYESAKLFYQDKKDDEIEGSGGVDKACLIAMRNAIRVEMAKLGEHPSEDEVGLALESVFKALADAIRPC